MTWFTGARVILIAHFAGCTGTYPRTARRPFVAQTRGSRTLCGSQSANFGFNGALAS